MGGAPGTSGGVGQTDTGLPAHRLIVVGDGGVGKSCLTIQFFQKTFCEWYDPTIEEEYFQHCEVDGRWCKLDVLDTAGQHEFASMLDYHMGTGRGFLLVFSVTDSKSLEAAKRLYEKILRLKDVDNYPVVLVGNKIDLSMQREVDEREANEWARRIGIPYLETSAKEYINVDEAFYELVRQVRRHDYSGEDGIAGAGGGSPTAAAGAAATSGAAAPKETAKKKSSKKCAIL